MEQPRDRADHTVDEVMANITAALAASGWTARSLRNFTLATFTRPTDDGIMAVVDIRLRGPKTPPTDIRVTAGVGYQPALDLMPLMTLTAYGILVTQHDDQMPLTVTLDDQHHPVEVADQVVTGVNQWALPFAQRFSDIDAIDAALREQLQRSGSDGDRMLTKRRLVLLTAAGRWNSARELLTGFPAEDRYDRRFLRQLNRWWDAGRTEIPPLEETLALLPAKPPWHRPIWADAKTNVRAKRQAEESVRARARGRSVDELTTLLTDAYATSGIEVAPSRIANTARAMEVQAGPFGKAKATLRALAMLGAVGGDVVTRVKDGPVPVPSWLQPPERASFPVTFRSRQRAAVVLNPDAADFIDRIGTQAPGRLGFVQNIDVWLDDSGTDLLVCIGERRVGSLSAQDAAAYAPVLRAAAIFDEAPLVRGVLTRPGGDGPIMLELPLPA
jgi:hypothetical protein